MIGFDIGTQGEWQTFFLIVLGTILTISVFVLYITHRVAQYFNLKQKSIILYIAVMLATAALWIFVLGRMGVSIAL